MKKKLPIILPFIIMPVIIPIYSFIDHKFLVDIFGCGCTPSSNANDVRQIVFEILTFLLSVLGLFTCRTLNSKYAKILYCLAVITFNVLLLLWVLQTFQWN